MTTARDITKQLIDRAKNLQEFIVERDMNEIPLHGTIKFDIKHTHGKPAKIIVYAISQQEAEQMVDEWFAEDIE